MAKIDLREAITVLHSNLDCMFCGNTLKADRFYPSASRNAMTRADEKGVTKCIICKDCAQAFFDYLYQIYKDPQKALYRFCAALDYYYDEHLCNQMEKFNPSAYVEEYMKKVMYNPKISSKTFGDAIVAVPESETFGEVTTGDDGFTEEDRKNRREILSRFHYDPFEKEPIDARRKLYRDLVTMVDPAMDDDLVRQRAAIEIVRSFYRIDTWTDSINDLSKDPQSLLRNSKQIKELIDAKNKETDMVTKFSKDHGFAERYATAKSRGTGTLSATIRDMEDFDFDDGKVNFYDIKTGASMQQAADISTRAIIKQLSLSEADYVDMLKQQRERLTNLESELARTQEELRMVYKQITKQELLRELATDLAKKGLGKEEITKMVLSEIHFDSELTQLLKNESEKTAEKILDNNQEA